MDKRSAVEQWLEFAGVLIVVVAGQLPEKGQSATVGAERIEERLALDSVPLHIRGIIDVARSWAAAELGQDWREVD